MAFPQISLHHEQESRLEDKTAQHSNYQAGFLLSCIPSATSYDKSRANHTDMVSLINTEAFHDTVGKLEATQEVCLRLHQWSTKKLSDSSVSLPILDLVQYCSAAIQQCKNLLTIGTPLLPLPFVLEQVWRGLEGLGFEPRTDPKIYGESMLKLLLAECERRTAEVLDLLNKKARHGEGGEPKPRPKAQPYDVTRLDTAVKGVHENLARSKSQYMLEKRFRLQEDFGTYLMPQLGAFGGYLLRACEEGYPAKHSPGDKFPGETRMRETTLEILRLATDWAEWWRTSTDPLHIQTYKKISDVPYQKTLCIEVGHGSFGVVHQARNLKTDTIVAVKQIKEIYSLKKQGAVRKELSMLEICDHPNIVKLLDAYQVEEDPSTFYLVMEPWAPYTLHKFLRQDENQRLRESPWFSQGSYKAERQMIRIFRGLADGLSYLHEMSIKHKDLKPENILLYDDGPRGIRPIIADLGISKIFKKGNPTDYTGSTYAFLALEQVKFVGSTLRSDIWQLGCCFALTLSVFRQGSAGCTQLWNSIERTDEDCSCNIALEAKFFMETLESFCGHGTESQLRVYSLIVAMLELEPEQRCDIKTVKMILAKL